MKRKILPILFIAAFFTSCTTAYKTGQTPDDVYFSPARYDYDHDSSRVERRKDNTVYNDRYKTVNDTYEDREIRRRIYNRRYGRYDDRYIYPYGYNNYSPVYGDNKSGNQPTSSQPRKTNLGVYTNPSVNTSTTTNGKVSVQNNGSGVGNFIRKVFSGSGNNSDSYNNSSNSNTYSNNPSSSNNNSNNSNNSNSSSNKNNNNSSNVPVRKFDN